VPSPPDKELQIMASRLDRRIEELNRIRRPPASPLAAFGAREPAVCFSRSEQAPVAVAAVGSLEELARAIRRYRTGLQRQPWRFAQQSAPSRSVLRGRTAPDARRERDRTEIAAGVRPPRSRDWLGFLRGLLAWSLAKQPFQYFDHGSIFLLSMCREFSPSIPCNCADRNSATGRQSSWARMSRMRWGPHSTPR